MPSMVWFRDDLRTSDHAALVQASRDPSGTIALYVLDEESPGTRSLGGAAKWWLHHSLKSLAQDLAALGIPLILKRGPAVGVVRDVVKNLGVTHVYWNRRYGPERLIDAELKDALRAAGISAQSYPGSLLFEPWEVATRSGTPFKVFTAFWRACLQHHLPATPLSAPQPISQPVGQPIARAFDGSNFNGPSSDGFSSDNLADWSLLPTWPHDFAQTWQPGEDGAHARLADFLDSRINDYGNKRDFPAQQVTSGLSPYLRWGEISPRTVFHTALASGEDVGKFLSEIGWREFAWHTLFHFPAVTDTNLDRRFDFMPWLPADSPEYRDNLRAWKYGKTGFALVDAGMKELWLTGTMHNRVRMITASFLTKNLLIDWRIGEAWFWDTLVDADRASNPFNWQWVAGSGADAAPYFRVFNPELQAKKFDAQGAYAAKFAPDSLLHSPVVDLRESRMQALSAYDVVKSVPRSVHDENE